MERIKGIRGCYNQSEKVYDWLVNHGWKIGSNAFTRDDFWDETKVYYIIDGILYIATSNSHVIKLLDVEEILPWRADRGDTYYFVSDWLDVCEEEEQYYGKDERRWKSRNYFKNEEDAMAFLEKILAVRKELKM